MVALPPTSPSLTPSQHDQLLELLASPDHSLSEIAQQLGVPLARLSLYLATTEEGQDCIALLQNLCATRARLAAAALLPRAITALKHNLNDYDALVRAGTATDYHHDRARRAAHLLLRIASGPSRGTGLLPGVPRRATPFLATPTSLGLSSRAPARPPNMQPDHHGSLRATTPRHASASTPAHTSTPHPAPTLHPEAVRRSTQQQVQAATPPHPQSHTHNGPDHAPDLMTTATHNRALRPDPEGVVIHAHPTPAQTLRALAGAPTPLLITSMPP